MRLSITADDFGGSLVKLLGEKDQVLAFPPFRGTVTDLRAIEVVLTRRNTFGPLHQVPKRAMAYGTGNFMTEGEEWSGAHQLYEQGLLGKPRIKRLQESMSFLKNEPDVDSVLSPGAPFT